MPSAEPTSARTSDLAALVVDWGGVLTNNLDESMAEVMAGSGVDMSFFSQILGDWLGPNVEQEAQSRTLRNNSLLNSRADKVARLAMSVFCSACLMPLNMLRK
jgi:hypothetical protein